MGKKKIPIKFQADWMNEMEKFRKWKNNPLADIRDKTENEIIKKWKELK